MAYATSSLAQQGGAGVCRRAEACEKAKRFAVSVTCGTPFLRV